MNDFEAKKGLVANNNNFVRAQKYCNLWLIELCSKPKKFIFATLRCSENPLLIDKPKVKQPEVFCALNQVFCDLERLGQASRGKIR